MIGSQSRSARSRLLRRCLRAASYHVVGNGRALKEQMELTPAEAEAVVTYRSKNGLFKDFESFEEYFRPGVVKAAKV